MAWKTTMTKNQNRKNRRAGSASRRLISTKSRITRSMSTSDSGGRSRPGRAYSTIGVNKKRAGAAPIDSARIRPATTARSEPRRHTLPLTARGERALPFYRPLTAGLVSVAFERFLCLLLGPAGSGREAHQEPVQVDVLLLGQACQEQPGPGNLAPLVLADRLLDRPDRLCEGPLVPGASDLLEAPADFQSLILAIHIGPPIGTGSSSALANSL